MALPMPMPKTAPANLSLGNLFRELAGDGLEVAQAELSLARAEALGISKRIITGLAICVVSFIFVLATVIILAEGAVAALQPFVNNVAVADLAVGIVLLVLSAFLMWLGSTFLPRNYKPVGSIFRWLAGKGAA